MKTIRYCRHVKQDGIPCGSPPLRGQNYCHFHPRYKGYPLRTWPNQRRLGGSRFTRRKALNLKAAEAALKRVDRELASGTCPHPERARTIRHALQMLVSSLRYTQAQGELGGLTTIGEGVFEGRQVQ